MNTPEEIEYRRDLARIQAAGEYNLRHLAQHLHAAGQQDKLFRLLVKNQAWLEAKFARLGGHDAYTGDLELATGSFGDPLTPSHLLTLVQLHAARRAVNQQTGLYNDTDLATLTWLGHESEALSHARLRDDPRQKAGGLLLIYNSLRERGGHAPGLLDEAEEAIAAIHAPVARLNALCDLALARGLASDGRAEAHFLRSGAWPAA